MVRIQRNHLNVTQLHGVFKTVGFTRRTSPRKSKKPDYFESTWEAKKCPRSPSAPFYKLTERMYCVYFAFDEGASKIFEGRAVLVRRCFTSEKLAASLKMDFIIDSQMRIKLRRVHEKTIRNMGYWYEIVRERDLESFQALYLEKPLALIQ